MRDVPAGIRPNLFGQETAQAFIILLDITHANGTIYLCNNSVDLNTEPATGEFWEIEQSTDLWETESGDLWEIESSEGGGGTGQTYLAFPFTMTLPQDIEGQTSTAQLTVDNCSRYLIDEIRLQEEPLTVKMQVVQASTMEVVASYVDYSVRDVRFSVTSLSMVLTLENYMQEPFPKDIMSQYLFPGLFA